MKPGIDYLNLDYGAHFHFASVASNNGHDGDYADGSAFFGQPEVLNDFGYRSIHTEAVLVKALVQVYYQRTYSKAYYIGCSTGGRQAMKTAHLYPDDFDGLVAGAPALDFNHLLGGVVLWERYLGAPNSESSPSFISHHLWGVIAKETLRQCDYMDGVIDGILTEPDLCIFRPEELLCSTEDDASCLTPLQVKALRKIYEPIFGTNAKRIVPRFDPMGDADGPYEIFNGKIAPTAQV
jgi:feruloyl esterase